MPDAVLTILKFGFLALLYLFLYRVVRVVVAEMKAPAPAPIPVGAPTPQAAPVEKSRGRGPGRVRILEPADRQGETLTIGDELTIGRGGGCSLILDDGFVSQVHARIFRREGEVFAEDLGSRNGSLLNGAPLHAAEPLRRGDRIQLGGTIIEVGK